MAKKVTGRILIVIGVLSALLIVGIMSISVVPSSEITRARLHAIKRRVHTYYATHRTLPKTLSDVPRPPPDDYRGFSLKDAWNRPVLYEPQPDGSVVLRSLGSSGTEGDPEALSLQFDPAGSP